MKFTKEELSKFATLDEVEKDIFTPEEIEDIHKKAELRSKARQKMSETLSAAVVQYMSQQGIGFNELTRRLEMSSATTSKILRGDANLTIETIASVAQVIGKTPVMKFE